MAPEAAQAAIRGQADSVPEFSEASIGAVVAEEQAVFGTGGVEAVGLGEVAGDEVIDHHADVGLGTAEFNGRLAARPARGVDAGHEALGGGFLVASGAVDLAGQEEAAGAADFQGASKLAGVDEVVFHGVPRTEHLGGFQTGDGSNHGQLHVGREAGVGALDVDLVGAESLGFQKERVRVLVREADDLVLDGGAVARAGGLDGPVIHGRAVQVVADEIVSLRRGVDLVAGHLGAPAGRRDVGVDGVRRGLVPFGAGRRIEAEPEGPLTPVLHARLVVVDAGGGQARRGAGLEAAEFKAGLAQVLGQGSRGRFAAASARGLGVAQDDTALQEGAGGDHGGTGADFPAIGRADAAHAPLRGSARGFGVPDKALDVGLEEHQVGLRLQFMPHEAAVGVLVALGAEGADGRALAGVQLTNLDLGAVGIAAHLAAEGVDFADEVALGRAADGGVAGHLGDGAEAGAQEGGAAAHARGGEGRLATRVAGADNDDVEETGHG